MSLRYLVIMIPTVYSYIHTSVFIHSFSIPKVFFLRFYLFIFRERGREGERAGEKHQCVIAPHVPPTGDLACNPVMCPGWELNQGHFGSQASAQSTEPHQPGPSFLFWYIFWLNRHYHQVIFVFVFSVRTCGCHIAWYLIYLGLLPFLFN